MSITCFTSLHVIILIVSPTLISVKLGRVLVLGALGPWGIMILIDLDLRGGLH